jgi:hypothetical protein
VLGAGLCVGFTCCGNDEGLPRGHRQAGQRPPCGKRARSSATRVVCPDGR